MSYLNENSLIQIIKERKSTVLFSEQSVEPEKIELLFEAARWAPSAYNEQPWRFIYACKEDKEAYNRFISCLIPANAEWASKAPVIALSLGKKTYSHNNETNRFSYYDTGMAVGQMLLQATAMGLAVHQMGGFSIKKAIKNLNIPEELEPIAMMAIGYKSNSNDFPAHLVERENKQRSRKSIDEIASKQISANPEF